MKPTTNDQPIYVLIGIQARSTSTRFPGKIYETIGNKRVLEHVIDKAQSAAQHVARYVKHRKVVCQTAVLHPANDHKLVETFRHCDGVLFISGDEDDVLSRYVTAAQMTKADYVVRLTSDCPLILDFIINKHINVAVFNKKDYVSNVEETCRNIADGFDCEVLSKRAIEWLSENAKSKDDKEHVTTALRRQKPFNLTYGFVSMKLDSSDFKFSLDTLEDLERIRSYYHKLEHKKDLSVKIFGSHNIYDL